MFIKEIELVEKGISPVMIWATELAGDIKKSMMIYNYRDMN